MYVPLPSIVIQPHLLFIRYQLPKGTVNNVYILAEPVLVLETVYLVDLILRTENLLPIIVYVKMDIMKEVSYAINVSTLVTNVLQKLTVLITITIHVMKISQVHTTIMDSVTNAPTLV